MKSHPNRRRIRLRADVSCSRKPTKRFEVRLNDTKSIHFGQKGSQTFIDHANEQKKKAWIARHKVREDWDDPFTAGFWSKHALWNAKDMHQSLHILSTKYNIEVSCEKLSRCM